MICQHSAFTGTNDLFQIEFYDNYSLSPTVYLTEEMLPIGEAQHVGSMAPQLAFLTGPISVVWNPQIKAYLMRR